MHTHERTCTDAHVHLHTDWRVAASPHPEALRFLKRCELALRFSSLRHDSTNIERPEVPQAALVSRAWGRQCDCKDDACTSRVRA